MTSALDTSRAACVSLFTREWIEIHIQESSKPLLFLSPSLRGSGLKFLLQEITVMWHHMSPSLRGSGLK